MMFVILNYLFNIFGSLNVEGEEDNCISVSNSF